MYGRDQTHNMSITAYYFANFYFILYYCNRYQIILAVGNYFFVRKCQECVVFLVLIYSIEHEN